MARDRTIELAGQPYGFSIRGIKHIITSWAVRLIAFCARHSPWSWLHRMGDLLGLGVLRFARSRRSMAHDNIRLGLDGPMSDCEIDRIVRKSTQNIVKTMLELFKVPTMSPDQLRARVSVQDMERIGEALERGNGVLLMTAHYGNWEYLGIRTSLDYGSVGVARAPAHSATANILNSARSAYGSDILDRDDVRGMLKALSNNQVLFMVADQHWAEGGVQVELLGRPVMAPRGVAQLFAHTGCAVIPAFCLRREDDSLDLRILPEIEMVNTGDRGADVTENTQRMYDVYSEMICKYPEQWLWLHRRWRNLESEQETSETESQ
jgi:KDO2-lipid IV(A) lauroyltransferase